MPALPAALPGKAMPELPEVELVARNLDRLICGRTIIRAELIRSRLAPDNTPKQFARWLIVRIGGLSQL